MKKLLFYTCLFLATSNLFANTLNSTSNGSWTSNSIWSGGPSPGLTLSSDVINVTKTVKVNGSLNVPQNASPQITVSNDTLTITGDLIAGTNSQLTLTVTNNGVVKIQGSLTGAASSNITLNVSNGGVLYVKNNVTIDNNASTSFTGTGTILIDGNLTAQNFNGTVDGLIAVHGTSTTNLVLQTSSTNKTYTDNSFSVQQDNRNNPTSAVKKAGTYADFAALYPNLCAISDYCRTNYMALPVVWKGISATNTATGVTVSWATLSEKNNNYFVIERSEDGLAWDEVGSVSGSGTTEVESTYSFLDETVTEGLFYYRVKQVDFDGKSENSSLVYVNVTNVSIIKGLYPNPNEGTFTLSLGSEEITSISIRNAQGIAMSSSISQNDKVFTVSLENYSSGLYTVYVISAGKVYQSKFVVK